MGDGPEAGALHELAHRVGILDRTEFVGAVPLRRVPELVRDASVAVSSHRSDVFGELVFSTKAAEYVAIGIPTVCASTTTMHDYFTDDELCFFDAGDPDDLARALREVLDHRDDATRMSRAATRKLRTLYQQNHTDVLVESVESLVPAANA